MTSLVVFKRIKPSRLNDKAMVGELLKGMEKEGVDIRNDLERTTKTWKDKPDFEIVSNLNPNGPEVLVGTDDKVYKFIDEGTSVRYATMTSDFIPKTIPGVIDSRAGKGKVLFVSKRVKRPGIKARGFTKIVYKKHQSQFRRRMELAMRDAVKKSGHEL